MPPPLCTVEYPYFHIAIGGVCDYITSCCNPTRHPHFLPEPLPHFLYLVAKVNAGP